MTEKRFEVVLNEFDECEYIMDKVDCEDRDFAEFIDFVEDICNENEQLKKALRELLEEYGNSYYTDLFDKLFNLEYREWYNPTAPNNEPYVDWEKIAKEKELEE